MKENPDASREAINYIDNIFRVCFQDCSDSSHEAESHENRFDGIVRDQIDIADYIRRFLLPEYVAALKAFVLEHDIQDDELESPSVLELPIPYEEVKDLYDGS